MNSLSINLYWKEKDSVYSIIKFNQIADLYYCRYVHGIRAEVEKTEKQLVLFSETLEEWLNVQKNWMYLESIFSSPDIQR